MELEKMLEYEKISKYVFGRYFNRYQYIREDLIQEGIIALWRGEKFYNSIQGAYSSYVIKVVWNAMRHYLRKEYKHLSNVEIEDLKFDLEDNISSSFEDLLTFRENLKRVLNSIHKGKEVYVKIVNLLIDGYTQKEIASMLGYSRQYTNKKINKLRDLLKEEISND